MNYLQYKKKILFTAEKVIPQRILSDEFHALGITEYTYYEGTKEASYIYPKIISTTGDEGYLLFDMFNLNIKFPVSKPLYSSDYLNDQFMYSNGEWGVLRYHNVIVYDGSEDWHTEGEGVFSVALPEDIEPLSYENEAKWIQSNITNKYRSRLNLTDYDNCIAVGENAISVYINSDITDIAQFKSILQNLTLKGTPFTVIYKVNNNVWDVFPDNVQRYLKKYKL